MWRADEQVELLWLSFNLGTDDSRNLQSIPVIGSLLERGAHVVAYDPIVTESMRKRFPGIESTELSAATVKSAHAVTVAIS